MRIMEISSWSDFKNLVNGKMLLMQYVEAGNNYEISAPESSSFLWHTSLLKGSSDAADFETNFKATANQPLENKAAAGRPERVAASPQPNNTMEKWKGFHLEMAAEDTTATIDISFDHDVYLKGGNVYSDDCDCEDYVSASIVLKANPAYVIKADLLKNVYMAPNLLIPFISSECTFLPSTVMLRVTYTKGAPTDTARCVSALADYFEPL